MSVKNSSRLHSAYCMDAFSQYCKESMAVALQRRIQQICTVFLDLQPPSSEDYTGCAGLTRTSECCWTTARTKLRSNRSQMWKRRRDVSQLWNQKESTLALQKLAENIGGTIKSVPRILFLHALIMGHESRSSHKHVPGSVEVQP